MAYAVKKAGVQFFVTVDSSADLTGLAGTFSIQVRDNNSGAINEAGNVIVAGFAELAESLGTYQAPVTINNTGDYTVIVESSEQSFQSITAPLVVAAANIDDVKNVVDLLQTDLSSVKTQIDLLDEAELNNIAESLQVVQNTVSNVEDLIINKTTDLVFAGVDESAKFTTGQVVKGANSEAYGTVDSVSFDGTDTTVSLVHVVGSFENGEAILDDQGATLATLSSFVEGNTTVDSVLEFVRQINDALNGGDTGILEVLKGYTDDIELMLTGSEFLRDGTTPNPFYDVNNPGVAKEASVQAVLADLVTVKTDIENTRVSVEGKIDALIGADGDAPEAGTLFGRVAGIKSVVDANQASLTDAGFGLEALKGLIETADAAIDTLAARFNDGGDIEVRFDGIDDAIAAAQAALESRFDAVDASLSTINQKLDDIKLNGVAARVFV